MVSPDIQQLFSRIAADYDRVNHILSFCCDYHWRRSFLRALPYTSGMTVLDLCTGTADCALGAVKYNQDIDVFGVDFSLPMLAAAQKKIKRLRGRRAITLINADARTLPFRDGMFDITVSAFGLRNLLATEETAIPEIARTLKTDGRLCLLEFTPPPSSRLKNFYRFYLKTLIPAVGGRLSRSPSAYQYLAESITSFLPPENVAALLARYSFTEIFYQPLSGGIAYIYQAKK